MSRFNLRAENSSKTTNLAGGEAFAESPKLELVSILLTSFVKNQFYRDADDTVARLKELVVEIKDKEFVAKAAIYARTKFGMRSVSHVVARELARVSGEKWTRRFFNKIVYRVDDMLEIIAYYLEDNGGKPLTNAMKKGFRDALNRFDEYHLAKYRKENSEVKLVDLFNLVHPIPDKNQAKSYKKLMEGKLRATETWETKLTQAGQEAEDEEEKEELKAAAWKDLVMEGKIGYFALLRNLRNIIEQAADDKVLDKAIELLTNETAIKKSLVLPFRFLTAIEEIEKIGGAKARKVIVALNKAVDISTSNVPKFEGTTLIALDESGSMDGKPMEIGSLFAAVLIKANNADLITFDNHARFRNFNPTDSTLTIAEHIKRGFSGGGTNFHAIFEQAQASGEKYDRIIILSDMQAWVGWSTPTSALRDYKKQTGANPHVFSFDLAGHGTLQFPENNVYALAGFSEKAFDIMKLLEQDKKALIHEIEKIVI